MYPPRISSQGRSNSPLIQEKFLSEAFNENQILVRVRVIAPRIFTQKLPHLRIVLLGTKLILSFLLLRHLANVVFMASTMVSLELRILPHMKVSSFSVQLTSN